MTLKYYLYGEQQRQAAADKAAAGKAAARGS
jgi:hypothetical protein